MPTRKRRASQLGVPIDQLPDGRGKHSNHCKGLDHSRWQDGRILSSDDYTKTRVGISHPFADSNGYVYEHKLVAITSGTPGAYLLHRFPDKYVIHHRNGDRQDNRIENLQIMTKTRHSSIHLPERDPKTGRFVGKKRARRLLDGVLWEEYPNG